MRHFSLLLFLTIVTIQVSAQNKANESTLLWRISGNGLHSPSYLYGTMHLRDKRVFNLADSVLLKLNECDAFAIEIDPDSMSQQLISDQLSSNNFKMRVLLGDDDYQEFQHNLKDEAGLDPTMLKTQNPFLLKNYINLNKGIRNDMPTFLDGYLYRIARENGKRVVALENIMDQLNLLKNISPHLTSEVVKNELGLNKSLSKVDLISVYTSGNLDALEKVSHQMSDSAYLLMFTIRNMNMIKRINGFLAKQTTFIAVGAGHLPGREGLINLLKNEGYTVTPVIPSFKGLAAKFKSNNFQVPWKTMIYPQNGYSIEMPLPPVENTFVENLKVSSDIGSGLIYISNAVFIPENANALTEDQKIKNIIDIYWKKQNTEILDKKSIYFNGKPITEFTLMKSGYYYKARILFHENSTYLLLAGGTKQSIDSPDVNRYFESIRFIPIKPRNWNVYHSEEGAFSVYFPGKPQENVLSIPTSNERMIHTHMFTGTDDLAGIQYLVQYFSGEGLIYPNDSSMLNSIISSLGKKDGIDSIQSHPIVIDGFPGEEGILYQSSKSIFKMRVYLRGSRGYSLLAVYPLTRADDPNLNIFFNSFQLTAYKDSSWQKTELFQGTVSLELPSKGTFKTKDESYNAVCDSTLKYESQDKYSGINFEFAKCLINKYYSTCAYDSILTETMKDYISDEDSVISKSYFLYEGIPSLDFKLNKKGSHNFSHFRLYLNDSSIYFAYTYIPLAYEHSPMAEQLFNSVKFLKKQDPSAILISKTQKLLQDLQSTDSATYEGARNRIYKYKFKKVDLPQVYEALLHNYPDDSTEYNSPKGSLLSAIIPIADSSFLNFIQQVYSKWKSNGSLQLDALDVLAHIKTSASIDLLYKLLLKETPDTRSYSLFWTLRDSLELSRKHIPDVIHLITNANYTDDIAELIYNMSEKKLLSVEDLKPFWNLLFEAADNQLNDLKKLEKSEYFNVALIRILTCINTAESAKKLELFRNEKNLYGKLIASIGLLKMGKEVKKHSLEELATNPGFRIQLYNELDSIHRTSLFPARYYSQKYFAESDLWEYFLNMEEEEPATIEFKGTRDMMFKGENKRFYLYKVTIKYEDEDQNEEYFGVSGPYPINGKEVIINAELTGSSFDNFDEKSLDEHLKSYLAEGE